MTVIQDYRHISYKVVWYSHLLKHFPQFVVINTVNGFGIVNKADAFLELSCFIFFQTILPASWEICMQIKKQWLEMDMEHQTSSKLGKEYAKAVYCHPAYLTFFFSLTYFT